MNANAEPEVLPGFIRRIDWGMESSSKRQTGTVSKGQTEQAGLSHKIAGNSRLLCGERLGLMDRAERILPGFLGVAPAVHQFRLDFGQINCACGSVAQHLRSQFLRARLAIE